jgi:hypothetical protein
MRRPQRATGRIGTTAVIVGIALCTWVAPVHGADPASSTGGVAPRDPGSDDDPAFVALKLSGRVVRTSDGAVSIALSASALAASAPASGSLDTSLTGTFREPPGQGTDDAGHTYTDKNYWNFCGPGATAVTLHYWPNMTRIIDNYIAGSFREPHQPTGGPIATTYWTNTKGRAAIMAIAETWFQPPVSYSWPYRGIVRWEGSFPAGAPINRIRDMVNWRASGEATLAYFYVVSSAGSFSSAAAFHSDIVSDIYNAKAPVVVDVETGNGSVHLPGWTTGKGINHSVTVVGYNDTSSTYTIMDTCGAGCENGSGSGGVHTISQSTLYTLMKAETDGDGIVW